MTRHMSKACRAVNCAFKTLGSFAMIKQRSVVVCSHTTNLTQACIPHTLQPHSLAGLHVQCTSRTVHHII